MSRDWVTENGGEKRPPKGPFFRVFSKEKAKRLSQAAIIGVAIFGTSGLSLMPMFTMA